MGAGEADAEEAAESVLREEALRRGDPLTDEEGVAVREGGGDREGSELGCGEALTGAEAEPDTTADGVALAMGGAVLEPEAPPLLAVGVKVTCCTEVGVLPFPE